MTPPTWMVPHRSMRPMSHKVPMGGSTCSTRWLPCLLAGRAISVLQCATSLLGTIVFSVTSPSPMARLLTRTAVMAWCSTRLSTQRVMLCGCTGASACPRPARACRLRQPRAAGWRVSRLTWLRWPSLPVDLLPQSFRLTEPASRSIHSLRHQVSGAYGIVTTSSTRASRDTSFAGLGRRPPRVR